MDTRYMVSRPGGDRTGAIGLTRARRTVRTQLRHHAVERNRRMRIKERGEEDWGGWRQDLAPTMEAWERRVTNANPGEVVLVDIEDYPYTVATRTIDVAVPTIATDGNDDVDLIFSWLVRNTTGRNGGICNRRPIDGTSTWSQHSPWPKPDPGANAVDWFAIPDTMDALYDQAAQLAAAAKADPEEVPVGLILVGDRAWTPDAGWHASGAAYHRHLHIEGRRKRSGTPRASCP